MTLALRALVIEQVVEEGPATQKLAGAGGLEPLGGCFAGLELRHFSRCGGHKQAEYDVAVPSSKTPPFKQCFQSGPLRPNRCCR